MSLAQKLQGVEVVVKFKHRNGRNKFFGGAIYDLKPGSFLILSDGKLDADSLAKVNGIHTKVFSFYNPNQGVVAIRRKTNKSIVFENKVAENAYSGRPLSKDEIEGLRNSGVWYD